MASVVDRIRSAWNVFIGQPDLTQDVDIGRSSGYRPDKVRMRYSNEKSIISSIYTRLGIDVAAVTMRHVRLDKNDRYRSTVDSGLNNCLTLEANIDQTARAFRQDIAMSLFDEGVIAIVPVDTAYNPNETEGFDVRTLRVGRIVSWYPRHVTVNIYNDRTGLREDVTMSKEVVAIVENPFYNVMNEPNSTLQRLIRKLNLLDVVDEASSSGKLDIIIQLPYVIKTDARREQAEIRRQAIEDQLAGSKYGVAYTDGTERITQLNRPAENNLLKQVEFLTKMLYGQLGLTESIFSGTASESEMLNYHNRTIEPILTAITEAMRRSFLSKTARTQGQTVEYYRDPFKLVAVSNIAEIADKFTRNEILTSNEVRGIIGFDPSGQKSADELRNKNLPLQNTEEGFEEPYLEGEIIENEARALPPGQTSVSQII